MEITYLGHSCFKLKSKAGLVLYTDPYKNETVGLKLVKDVADVVTISHDHEDHNAREMITGAVNRQKLCD
jgi:L-ascorbate metabolism protein UlaG (beta-lactamase superfamily)